MMELFKKRIFLKIKRVKNVVLYLNGGVNLFKNTLENIRGK